MGPSTFIMVLIGCAQATDQCAPIATLPIAYRSGVSCLDARAGMVAATGDLGYARIIAECRPQAQAPRKIPAKVSHTS